MGPPVARHEQCATAERKSWLAPESYAMSAPLAIVAAPRGVVR